MVRQARIPTLVVVSLVSACWAISGCTDDNQAVQNGTGGNANQGTGGSSAATGGASNSTANSTGTAVHQGGATNVASNTGTAPSASGGVGGTTSENTGTTTAVGGTTSTASGTPPGTVCPALNAAGSELKKGAACTAADPQLCYKSCGPKGSGGYKSETCTAAAYAEVASCIWTLTDYSCYKVPASVTAMDATCPAKIDPTATMQGGLACTVAPCTSCTGATGLYLDSNNAEKTGWCTCVRDTPDAASGKWSCGSTSPSVAWPCPGQAGC